MVAQRYFPLTEASIEEIRPMFNALERMRLRVSPASADYIEMTAVLDQLQALSTRVTGRPIRPPPPAPTAYPRD